MNWTMENILLLAFLAAAIGIDTRRRIIPNALTFPVIAAAIALNTYTGGAAGFWFSAAGLGAGVALMLLPFAVGGLGGGDVKMLAAVGALKGAEFAFYTFLFSAVAGGLIALVRVIATGRGRETLTNMRCIIMQLSVGIKPGTESQSHGAFPYSCAIAAGCLITNMVLPALVR